MDEYGSWPMEPITPVARRALLGPVRQIGYVVSDVEAVAADWVRRLGIGPWRVKHELVFDECRSAGEPINIEVSIASSYSAGIEVELIAQVAGPDSMYTAFLQQSGPGAQHVCFYPADYAAALRGLESSGMAVVLDGVIHGTAFAYLSDDAGQVIEIADVSAEGLAARAQRAAVEWDGSDPIRVA